MDKKTCFKCQQTKPLEDFYRHPEMADGRLNKCKQCAKTDVTANRNSNLDYYRAYDSVRSKEGQRLAGMTVRCKRYRAKNPRKYAAHSLLNSALKCKRIVRPNKCSKCAGEGTLHGHHESYDKPLEVVWLCPPCHSKRHKEMKAEGIEP